VHFGVVLIVIGIAGQAFNLDKEQTMGKGTHSKGPLYPGRLRSTRRTDNPNYGIPGSLLDVYKDGKFLTRLNPENPRSLKQAASLTILSPIIPPFRKIFI